MCGIVGQIAWKPGARVSEALLEKMCRALQHRGPDDSGTWVQDSVGLAMRRLRIIDLAGGHQPMDNAHCPHASQRGRVHIVYNGEIYNFRELRESLEKKGHQFASRSDTEVILHAYEEYGDDFLKHLNGMFGLALWDEREKSLLLARDRMGIKPVYYRAVPDSFSFASEIKALLVDPSVSREVDPFALDDFFALRCVPTPRSIFREIRKLEPGHYLKVRHGEVVNRPFWDYHPPRPEDKPLSHYLEVLDGLLKDCVQSHLISDVPLGVFLSGGLDSTSVAAYVSDAGRGLNSFTVYFGEKSFSERHEARAVADRYGLNHNEMLLTPNVRETIEKLSLVFDEPFADPSAIPTYHLCQFARNKVTVALSGDGGDELFAGYPTYIADALSGYYRRLPGFSRRWIQALVRSLPVSHTRVSFDYRLKAFVAAAHRPQPSAHAGWQAMFMEEDKSGLYTSEFDAARRGHMSDESSWQAFRAVADRSELEQMLYVDQRTKLLDEYLVKMDRLSMAHSLEVRVPLLDVRLVEFAATVPAKYKIRGMTTKYIIRRLMESRLPREVIHGEKKGFTPPMAGWFSGELKDFLRERFDPAEVRKTGILNADQPLRLLQEHLDRRRDNHRQIWTLLSFLLWREKWG
ncbi:MAG TPA: asparagine synthase (glutamine-hydrolyzing) [Elusimicrobiota bacterium]|nr:asparagine synthase (glutamine-hydrolyzing) [Elusimicrobiota bacterium]